MLNICKYMFSLIKKEENIIHVDFKKRKVILEKENIATKFCISCGEEIIKEFGDGFCSLSCKLVYKKENKNIK